MVYGISTLPQITALIASRAAHCLFIICLLLLAAPGVLYSQTESDTLLMTLEQSQQIALSHNPAIQSDKKELEKTRSQLSQARGQLYPSFSAFANYNHQFELPVFTIKFGGQTQTLRAGRPENVTAGFQLQQPFYMGGSLKAGYGITDESVKISVNELTLRKQAIISQVRQAFYMALYSQQLIRVSSEALTNAQRNLDQVQNQSEVGLASGFDVLRAKVQAANMRPQVIAARHKHEQALTGLRTAMGLKENVPIKARGELIYTETQWADSSIQSLQEIAFSKRLELENIEYNRKIHEYKLSLSRAKILPSVSATSLLQFQLQSDDFALYGNQYYRSISGGLNISIPLFHGGSNRAEIQEANVALRQVDDAERQIENRIAAEVESAYHKLIQTREQLVTQQETIVQARESLHLAELQYQEGTATQLDVLNAQLALLQSQTNESEYLLQHHIARDELLKAMNMLDFNQN